MNFKSTLTLLLLTVAGGGAWFVYHYLQPTAPASVTLSVLQNELTAEKLNRIEIERGERRLELHRGNGDDWSLRGNWPTRRPEVKELVALLTSLRSRFAPLVLDRDIQLSACGLENPAVRIAVRAGDKDYKLHLGEQPGDSNRFSRPVYLRLNDEKEIIRLGPGLVGLLDRPPDYYQQRRLFPSTITKQSESGDRVERVAARALAVDGPNGKYALSRDADDWTMREPVADRVDPDKAKTILSAVPDIWAEQFSNKSPKDLADCGLDKPTQTLTVTPEPEKGEPLTLLIGKQSQMKARTVTKPPPPNPRGFPPSEPTKETVHEAYLFAKLKDNDQIFEIKADKLKEMFVAPNSLRDDRLARFRTEDARTVAIARGGQEIVLAKDKGRWKLQKPQEGDAEDSKVNELLDKLTGLTARDQDIIDKADAKKYGFDVPTCVVRVTVEESTGEGDQKSKKPKTYVFTLGKREETKDKPKLYVKVDNWERVNAVEDSVVKLAERSPLAYRGRRVLDFFSGDLAKVEVERGNDKYVLEQVKDAWRLTFPEPAAADSSQVTRLTSDLSRLEAVEFVQDTPKPDDVDKLYGLAKPALSVALTFSKADKPAQKLLIGNQRGDKPEFFAKLEKAPAVFAVKKEIRDALDKSSLAFLPTELWHVEQDEIAELRLARETQDCRLKRDGANWKIAEPFEAAAAAERVQPLVAELATLRTERYEAHAAKQLANYGLDKPYLRLIVTPNAKKDNAADKKVEAAKDGKERVLLVGNPTAAGAKTRFAKLGDGEAVFVVPEKLVAAADYGPLDFLDRSLLAVDPKSIEIVKSSAPTGALTFEHKNNAWQVTAPAVNFPADQRAMAELLGVWSHLGAERFAAYGPKADAKEFGLDQPAATAQITVKVPAANPKDAPKPVEHRLLVGKPVAKDAGERFARLDNGPGIFVLNAAAAATLARGYLDYVDHTVLQFDPASVTSVRRNKQGSELELVKNDQGWRVVKPQALTADAQTIEEIAQQLSALRAERVAEFPVKDLKPFGLDAPAAVVKVLAKDSQGKPVEHVLKISTQANDHLATVLGSQKVVVLPPALAKRLLAEPIKFRDRNLARFADVDRIELERGPRKATFTKPEGTWKLTSPVDADAEQTDLEDFINSLSRLRADELVAEKADDKSYGLDKPEVRWRFQLGGKDVLSLVVGAREPDGLRRYAKLGNSDLVILLARPMTDQALKEYRSRTIWGSLDTAQVETLRFQYRQKPFSLEKVDNTWKVAGKPELKVNSESVSETLDALARLRAERYVVDKGADPRVYGLLPAELAVEIQTPAGKRTLEVGRQEGGSKRYYARVAQGNRSDVFVIAEADAGRIVRELGAFTSTPTTAKPALPVPKSSQP